MTKILDINPKLAQAQAIDRLEKMIDGCRAVRDGDGIHDDAKDFAKLVIRDCNRVIAMLEGKRFPGDNAG